MTYIYILHMLYVRLCYKETKIEHIFESDLLHIQTYCIASNTSNLTIRMMHLNTHPS